MKKYMWLVAGLMVAGVAYGQATGEKAIGEKAMGEKVRVSGGVYAGVATDISTDQDKLQLTYQTDDPRLGTNSGNHYESEVDDNEKNVCAEYGADIQLDWNGRHRLALLLEGEHEIERAFGERTETVTDAAGNPISRVKGQYNHPNERIHDLKAGAEYSYLPGRPGEALTVGYQFRWNNENAGLDQEIEEAGGWAKYTRNVLEQQITNQYHHAHLDYALPVAKGHLLDFGLAYDRRELTVRTEQDWDEVRILDTEYRHLTQYGGVHARYRLKAGPVEAMARLEYRATKMQNRWLHDVLPTATIRYHIDTIHSLSAFYTIVLIRPDAEHLDTTHVSDAYTQRFGKDDIVGIHVHNVALSYLANWSRAKVGAEVRYLTTTDGFNAIWMERGNQRIYTWGNEGVRHAVSLKPSVEAKLGRTTELYADATVMWDKRVAEAINLANPNWGIKANMSLTQQLAPASAAAHPYLVVRGDYGYHNTLDVYSYAGHGGSVGGDVKVNYRSLNVSLGYACMFQPSVHIVQGAYVGNVDFRPGGIHTVALRVEYEF